MRAERRLPSVDQRRPVQLRALQPHAHPLQAHGRLRSARAPRIGQSSPLRPSVPQPARVDQPSGARTRLGGNASRIRQPHGRHRDRCGQPAQSVRFRCRTGRLRDEEASRKRPAHLPPGRGNPLRRGGRPGRADGASAVALLGSQSRMVAQCRGSDEARRPQRPQDASSSRAPGRMLRNPRLRAAQPAGRTGKGPRHDHARDVALDRFRAARLQRTGAQELHLQCHGRPGRVAGRAVGLRRWHRTALAEWPFRSRSRRLRGRHRRAARATHGGRLSRDRVVRRNRGAAGFRCHWSGSDRYLRQRSATSTTARSTAARPAR